MECEREFHEWRARLPIKCASLACPTPLTCRIMKRCATVETRAAIEADIKADPDLIHVHSAEGID